MMIAVAVVLILMTWYVPLFSFVGMFICGVPIACLAAKYDWKMTVISLIGVFAVTFLVTGSLLSAVSMMLMSILPGAVAGICLGRNISFFTTLFITCLAVCLGWLFEVLVTDKLIHGEGIDAMLNETMDIFRNAFDTAVNNLPQQTNTEELKKMIDTMSELMVYTFKLYFPSIIVISSMVIGYVIVRFCGFFINRLKIKSVYIVPFAMLKAPKSMSYTAVALYIISLFGDNSGIFWAVCSNAVLILYTIIGFCGLSLFDNILSKRIPKGGLRVIIYAAVFMFGGLLMTIIINALVIAGIFDSTRNFRNISGGDKPFEGGDGGGWL